MTDAPEKIWAFHAPDIEENEPGCSIVAGEAPMFGAEEYTRSALILAQVAAAHQKLIEIRPIMPEGTKTQDYVEGFEAAEADYHRQIADAFPLDAQAALDAMLAQARRQECERVLALTLEAVGYTEDILSPQALNTIRGERTDD